MLQLPKMGDMTQTLPESNYRYATHSEEQTRIVTPPEGRYPMGDATIYRMLNEKTIVHLSVFSLHLLHVFPQGIETIASSVDGKDGG